MAMMKIRPVETLFAALTIAVPNIVAAQTTTAAQPSASASSSPAAAPAIEPEALAAMDRMSAALRAMPAFVLEADVTNEEVLETGQKLQFSGTVKVEARKPTGFRIDADADTVHRQFFYDGKSLTVFAPRLGYYASFPAPPSIGQTMDKAKTQVGIELPLADLFVWDSDQTIRARIKSGYALRPETIGDRSCFHYAFRQERVDWQIWIDEAEPAMPCKLVITNTEDPSMPQYTAVLHWGSRAVPPATDFTFVPPANAHEIPIVDMSKATAEGAAK